MHKALCHSGNSIVRLYNSSKYFRKNFRITQKKIQLMVSSQKNIFWNDYNIPRQFRFIIFFSHKQCILLKLIFQDKKLLFPLKICFVWWSSNSTFKQRGVHNPDLQTKRKRYFVFPSCMSNHFQNKKEEERRNCFLKNFHPYLRF